MPQGLLPYKYEKEKSASGMTALAGLPVYLDLASVLNLGESISEHLHTKTQGWTDEQIILSLILLNLAGGECVDDLCILEADEGFCRILQRIELKGLPRKKRRQTRDDGVRKSTGPSLRPQRSSGIFLLSTKSMFAPKASQ